jgi:hypothetical protein
MKTSSGPELRHELCKRSLSPPPCPSYGTETWYYHSASQLRTNGGEYLSELVPLLCVQQLRSPLISITTLYRCSESTGK